MISAQCRKNTKNGLRRLEAEEDENYATKHNKMEEEKDQSSALKII